MDTLLLEPKQANDARRSQRVLLRVGVVIHGYDAAGGPFCQTTHTLVVNAHGALVRLESRVVLGQMVTMRHGKTGEELYCKIARIAHDDSGNLQAGLEFMYPSPHFWGIAFPPEDWQPAPSLADHSTSHAGIHPVAQAA